MAGHERDGCRTIRFTMVEMLFAMAIGAFLIAGFTTFLIFVAKELSKLHANGEMRSEGAVATEKFKLDISYSSPSEILLWPVATDAQGMSFPIIRRNDYSLPPLIDGEIAWTHTVAYYVFTNEDGTQEIRRTIFSQRDNTLSRAERLLQLESVVMAGSGHDAYNGQNSTTETLARKVKNFRLGTGSSIVDARAAQISSEEVHLGSMLLSSGLHTVRFVTADDTYMQQNIGIDCLYMTPSHAPIEGECIPFSSLTAVNGHMSKGSMSPPHRWSNNAHLFFSASEPGAYIEFTLFNDMWIEANFDHRGAVADGTEKAVEPDSGENSLRLAGLRDAWVAHQQTGQGLKSRGGYDNSLLRLVVLPNPSGISAGRGQWCKITFSGSCLDKDAIIQTAYFMERASGASGVSGTLTAVTFHGGSASVTIKPGMTVQSDWVKLPYDPAKSYLIGLVLSPLSDDRYSSPLMLDTSQTGVYRLDRKYADPDFAKQVNWSEGSLPAGATLEAFNELPLASSIYISQPAAGTYTSKPFDAGVDMPQWEKFWGTFKNCSGGSVAVKFRTGSDPLMSDAPGWEAVPAQQLPATPADLSKLSPRRFIQFRAELKTAAPYLETPYLCDLAITWKGAAKLVDMGGKFSHGPDYGKFTVLLDGAPLATVNAFIDFELERQAGVQTVRQRFYVASDSHQVK